MSRIWALVKICFVVVAWSGVGLVAAAQAAPPLEVYGQLPNMRSMSISPDGRYIAMLMRNEDEDLATIYDRDKGEYIKAVDLSKVKASSIYFASEDYVILRASKTTRTFGYRGEFEFGAAFSWNLKTDKISQLIKRVDGIHPAQSGLGNIIGIDESGKYAYMPAWMGRSSESVRSVLRVQLENGRGRVAVRGGSDTSSWIVNDQGEPIAREDFDNVKGVYRIYHYEDGKRKLIFENETELRQNSLIGITPDKKALVISATPSELDRRSYFLLGFDGSIEGPIFNREDADVGRALRDINKTVFGVEYTGSAPSYEFLPGAVKGDPALTLAQYYPNSSVAIVDWSPDFDYVMMRVAGGVSPSYYLYDEAKKSLSKIATQYEDIPDNEVGDVLVLQIKARDGVRIPTILTLPPGAEMAAGHPAIVMPHGGPVAYDAVDFDWMAQYFASRGYAVIQPNFRGSSGFGWEFRKAGHGGWGRGVMQNDVTDVYGALVRGGIADPNRTCIVGGSYGGYSALAGGAFTPDLYQCVAAIAPVTDLELMLEEESSGGDGRKSERYRVWSNRIGLTLKERDKLREISPSRYAEEFKAPVLLIHGNDDTVVPIQQSRTMERALKRAGKPVEFVKLKGGDHWLSTSETRLDTLRALDAFVEKHIGEGAE